MNRIREEIITFNMKLGNIIKNMKKIQEKNEKLDVFVKNPAYHATLSEVECFGKKVVTKIGGTKDE